MRIITKIILSLIVLAFLLNVGTLNNIVFAAGNGTAQCTACLNANSQDINKCRTVCITTTQKDSALTTNGITNPAISKNLGGNPDESNSGATFSSYFVTVWRAMITIGALASLFNLVTGALEWITAGGEQTKVQHSRQRILEGIVGFAILAGSFAIIQVLGNIFGYDMLHITFPTP
jgi:hypothetical protein